MLDFLNGKKTYVMAGFMVVVALLKLVTDIEGIENLELLGVQDPINMLYTAGLIVTGRSALKKVEK